MEGDWLGLRERDASSGFLDAKMFQKPHRLSCWNIQNYFLSTNVISIHYLPDSIFYFFYFFMYVQHYVSVDKSAVGGTVQESP